MTDNTLLAAFLECDCDIGQHATPVYTMDKYKYTPPSLSMFAL